MVNGCDLHCKVLHVQEHNHLMSLYLLTFMMPSCTRLTPHFFMLNFEGSDGTGAVQLACTCADGTGVVQLTSMCADVTGAVQLASMCADGTGAVQLASLCADGTGAVQLASMCAGCLHVC